MFLSSRRALAVFTSATLTLLRTLLCPFVTTSMVIKEEKKKEKRMGKERNREDRSSTDCLQRENDKTIAKLTECWLAGYLIATSFL